jgi:hypothetical protein
LGRLLASSLRKKMKERWCSSPASSSGGPPAKLRRGESLPRLDHLGSSSIVSWIEERECERVNGREREAARGAGQGGDARRDEWGRGGNVARKFCARDTHSLQRADCPRRTGGLSMW